MRFLHILIVNFFYSQKNIYERLTPEQNMNFKYKKYTVRELNPFLQKQKYNL